MFFFQLERIAAPTQASVRHSVLSRDLEECYKHRMEENVKQKVPQYRRWWRETTRHLEELRTSLVRQKILPPSNKKFGNFSRKINNDSKLRECTSKIDEIVANSSKNSNIPVFPRLRLTKDKNCNTRVPVSITVLNFPPK